MVVTIACRWANVDEMGGGNKDLYKNGILCIDFIPLTCSRFGLFRISTKMTVEFRRTKRMRLAQRNAEFALCSISSLSALDAYYARVASKEACNLV